MFIIKLLHIFQGYVKFEGYSQNPSVFINDCINNCLDIWELYCDKDYISAFIIKSQYKLLRPIAKKSNSKIKIKSKHGLPFKVKFLKNRKGLIVGAFIFFIIIFIFSNFIWSVNINVDKETNIDSIQSSLNELGIKNGACIKKLDVKMIEKELMLKQSEIAWVAVNITGSVAEIEISIKTETPDNQTNDTPCNLIASESGQIVRSEVLSGQKEFTLFQAVEKGQILVNGILQGEGEQISYKHSKGKVFALLRKSVNVTVPLTQERIKLIDKKIIRANLDIFNLNIPIILAREPDGNYEDIINKSTVNLFEKKLPISLTTQKFLIKESENIKLSIQEAKEQARNELLAKINSDSDAKILHSDENFEERNDAIILHASVLLEKNIAQEAPLAIENN